MRKSLVLTIAMMCLAGCSVEPSEADIKKAFEAEFSKVKTTPGNSALTLHGVKKLGCAKAESNPGYNCDVEVDAENFMGRQKKAVKVRFVKGDDGWVGIEERR